MPPSRGALAVRDHAYPANADLDAIRQQIEALNLAVGALASSTAHHSPKQAQEVADLLRKRVPAHKLDKGLLHALLEVLDQN